MEPEEVYEDLLEWRYGSTEARDPDWAEDYVAPLIGFPVMTGLGVAGIFGGRALDDSDIEVIGGIASVVGGIGTLVTAFTMLGRGVGSDNDVPEFRSEDEKIRIGIEANGLEVRF